MEFETVLKKRRSIRSYINEPIDKDVINTIIEAGIQAPSWKNSQCARYHVITSSEMLKKIKEETLPAFNLENCKDAPVLIVTSFVKNRSGFERNGLPSNELANIWGGYDLGLHNQNILLKATELGYGSLVMGIRDASKIKELLNISDEEIIVSIIAIGKSAKEIQQPKRKAVEEITKFY